MSVAAIVLAAGAATRMGQVKQLLPFRGKSFIEHSVAQAMGANFHPIIVTVGAESEAVRNAVEGLDVRIVESARWQSGMSASIAAGVGHLESLKTDCDAVAILLADQPLVTAFHLTQMANLLRQSSCTVVAARYGGIVGVPALFKRCLFARLIALDGETGARSLLRDPKEQVQSFELPEAAIDIDTPDDFASLAR